MFKSKIILSLSENIRVGKGFTNIFFYFYHGTLPNKAFYVNWIVGTWISFVFPTFLKSCVKKLAPQYKGLILMLVVANFTNTKWCKKAEND